MPSLQSSRTASPEASNQALGTWFSSLAGEWRLEREISDGSRFVGEASFERIADDNLSLTENGTFFSANQTALPAGRQWVWRLLPGGLIEVRYPEPDNRLYHQFTPDYVEGHWVGRAEHICGADVYCGLYRLGPARMEIVHDVCGPAKDYRLTSRFLRLASSDD